jgi:hypothetical protein
MGSSLSYPYKPDSNTIVELTARHVEYISGYRGIQEPFIALFEGEHTSENAKFMLAVADYKKNPTWDKCISIYHLYIRETGGGRLGDNGPGARNWVTTQERVNLAGPVVRDIDAKMSARRGQVGGPGDPRIYDEAFKYILDLSNFQLNFKRKLNDFIQGYGIDTLSRGNFTRFPEPAPARA